MTWPTFVDPDLCWRLSMALVHSLWQLPLIALGAWLVTKVPRIKRSLEATHTTYAVALAISLLALPVTLALLASTSMAPVALDLQTASVAPHVPQQPDASAAAQPSPSTAVLRGTRAVAQPSRVTAWPSSFAEARQAMLPSARWIAVAYFVGVLLMFMRLTDGIARSHKLRATATLVTEGPAHAALQRLARQWSMRVVPALGQVESLVTPVVIGLVRPIILFPASALSGLTCAEIEMILAHELAHVRRLDPWIHFGQRVAEALYFFNPAIWFLTRRLSTLREMCCDEVAVGDDAQSPAAARLQYVAALVRVVEISRPAGTPGLAGLAATGQNPSELRRRVARLMGEPLYEPLRLTRAGLLLLAVATSSLVVVPLIAESEPAQAEEKQSAAEVPEAAAEQPPRKPAADLPQYYDHPISVSGRALDERGEPIADATIYLAAANFRRLAETTTDSLGRYRFENVDMPIERANANAHYNHDTGRFEVFGTAPRYALSWRPVRWFRPGQDVVLDTSPGRPVGEQKTTYGSKEPIELDLTFTQPTNLKGRIVDDQGQPLPNTQLAIRRCEWIWTDEPGDWLIGAGNLESLNPRAVVPPEVKTRTTDADGRFEFTGLPSGYQWSIDVRPPGHSSRSISAVTGNTQEKTTSGGQPLYTGDFEVVFPRPLTVKFHVVHADTGKPAVKVGVGATVTQAGFWKTTDDKGMIEVPLAKGTYDISVSPRYGSPYLNTRREVNIDDNSDKAPIVLAIEPAAVLDITVVDADTGAPLEGVDFWLGGSRVDEQGQLHRYEMEHGWRSWEVETRISHYENPRTDKQGKMRILLEPGTHRVGVGINSTPPWYGGDRQGRVIACKPGEPLEMEFRLQKSKAAPDP